MDQGHMSRHMAPSRLSVNAGGLRAFSEDQRMQYLNNAIYKQEWPVMAIRFKMKSQQTNVSIF